MIAVVALLLCMLVASSAHAQTLTNADLGKKLHHAPATQDVYDMLKAHEYRAPVEVPIGPLVASTHATGPTAGPWDWPRRTIARRLDGTRIDVPPIVYGASERRGQRPRSVYPELPTRQRRAR